MQALPPLGEVLYIQTFLPTEEHIRGTSALQVTSNEDLASPKLGVNEWSHSCETCDGFLEECPGHHGHLELTIPIYRIFFVKYLIGVLNSICFYCLRARVPDTDPFHRVLRDLEPSVRLEHLLKYSSRYKYCGGTSENRGGVHPAHLTQGCGKRFLTFTNEDRDGVFIKAILPLEDEDEAAYRADPSGWKPFAISPADVYDSLRFISDDVCTLLGLNEWNKPHALMWKVLPIPSLNTRPCHTYSGLGGVKKKVYSDWTRLLKAIVSAQQSLKVAVETSDEHINLCVYTRNHITSRNFRECFEEPPRSSKACAKSRVLATGGTSKTVYGAVEGAWRHLMKCVTAFHSHRHKKFLSKLSAYGKPLINVEERFKFQKSGRFRGYVIARRVNNAMRGVLEGDIHMHPSQVGIPRQEAMNLSVKIYVHALNARAAYDWIVNGPRVYPGANYVQLTTGSEINLAHHANRRDIKIQDVLFVRRHLQDGDVVLVNRQPTLHKPSMMAFRAVIIEGYAIRLHYCVFLPMAADCDGDEVNVHVPQTDLARAELLELSMVESCIMKDGVVWIKFIQNAVTGAFLLSQRTGLTRDEVYTLVAALDVYELPPPTDPEAPIPTWDGKAIISCLFPPDFTLITKTMRIERGQFVSGTLTAQELNGVDGILNHLYRDYADKSVCTTFLYQGYLMFQAYVDLHGLSAGYYDTAISHRHRDYVRSGVASEELQNVMSQLACCARDTQTLLEYGDRFPKHTPQNHLSPVEHNLRRHIDSVNSMHLNSVRAYHRRVNKGDRNGVISSIESGASKTYNTLNQMCGMVGQIYVMYRRHGSVSSHFRPGMDKLRSVGFVPQSYSTGLTLQGVIAEAHAACESVINKNKGTSKSGYTVRKLTTCMMGVVADHFGRAVDTSGRVVWEHYGNDGYDPTVLTTATLRLGQVPLTEVSTILRTYGILWNPAQVVTRMAPDQRWWVAELPRLMSGSVELVNDSQALLECMTPAAREHWLAEIAGQTTQHSAVAGLVQEVSHLLAWHEQLYTAFVTRTTRFTDLSKVRCPFSFQHLFDRCRCLFGCTSASLVDLTPGEYPKLTQAFWNQLVCSRDVVGSNVMLEALYFDWMATKPLMVEWRFGRRELNWLFQEISALLRRAKITPGDSIGLHATQSLGEPFTQMTLKTPHLSGKFPSMVEGAVKFGNLVDGNFSNPIMTVVLKESIRDETSARLFALSLPRTYFRDICSVYPTYSFDNASDDHADDPDVPCTIRVRVDKDKALRRAVSLRAVALRIADVLHLPIACITTTFASEPEWGVVLTIPGTSKLWTNLQQVVPAHYPRRMIAHNIVYNLFFSVVIHGLLDIHNFVCDRTRIDSGGERWVVTTMGSCLETILQMPEVDTTRTTSSDCQDVCNVFGIRAAQKSLEHEFMEVMSGTVDERHIKLVARVMVSNLNIRGMKIKQSGQGIPPLQRAAYEQMSRQASDYCMKAERDYAHTICGAALTNRPMNVGTGYNLDLVFDFSDPAAKHRYSPLRLPPHVRPYPYVFSPKVDGLRAYLTFFRDASGKKICNLVSRTFQVYAVPSTALFPETIFEGTVLDGDMTVAPRDQEQQQHQPQQHHRSPPATYCFVVYDCVLACGNKTAALRYDQRLAIAREVVQSMGTQNFSTDVRQARDFTWLDMGADAAYALPTQGTKVSQAAFKVGRLPFSLTVKPVFAMEGLADFNAHRMHKFPFPTDGYIFTNLASHATPFRTFDAAVLKWKPKTVVHGQIYSGDTVDVTIGSNTCLEPPVQHARLTGFQTLLGAYMMHVPDECHKLRVVSAATHNRTLMPEPVREWQTYECAWNYNAKQWELLRWRDKHPNTLDTFCACVQVIRDDISLTDILNQLSDQASSASSASPVDVPAVSPVDVPPVSPVYDPSASPVYDPSASPVYNPVSPVYDPSADVTD